MEYIVTINYTKFKFKSGATALTFSELAKDNAIGEAEVEIEIVASKSLIDDISDALEEEDDF
jgi:hypothetical protein